MSRECLKCGNRIPLRVKINGKVKNLQRRKYCLICSPFGQHNTAQIHLEKKKRTTKGKERICKICGKTFISGKSARCAYCNFNVRLNHMKQKVYGMVGTSCWICGYNKGIGHTSILDFHHVDPLKKEMGLNNRQLAMRSWGIILNEMKKCMVLCCRCHREVHEGMITNTKLNNIYKLRWQKINFSMNN